MASLSLKAARNLVLSKGLLPCRGAEDTLKTLNYIQLDSISVIARAHHHVFFTRDKYYHSQDMSTLYQKQLAFEYWTHAASLLPMSVLPYFLPRMHSARERSGWVARRYEEHKALLPRVLAEIQKNGAMAASDFEGQKNRPGGWWNWKPAKVALEVLYWTGELMVTERRNFSKVYDLPERVVPSDLDWSLAQSATDFHILNVLRVMGVASAKEISNSFLPCTLKEVKHNVAELLEAGRVISCSIEGLKENYYLLPESLAELDKNSQLEKTYLLSPFDPFVIQRERLEKFFDFYYRLEAYVPKAKREKGYFALPILQRGAFVGTLDLKVDRKQSVLKILNASLSEKTNREALLSALKEFMLFNACESLSGHALISEGQSLRN